MFTCDASALLAMSDQSPLSVRLGNSDVGHAKMGFMPFTTITMPTLSTYEITIAGVTL